MPTQSTKVDRAPKSRWSAPERATRGHTRPRRDDQPSQHAVLPDSPNLLRRAMRHPAALPSWASPRTWSLRWTRTASPSRSRSRPRPSRTRWPAGTCSAAVQTGSGKTLGFGLPMISRLAGGRPATRRPRGLVLVPTRELAMQVPTPRAARPT